MNIFLIPPLLYEILLYPDTYLHLTFWTWLFHIISYNFIKIKYLTNIFFTASYFGSYFVLFGYITCLIFNPYLEYDLVKSKRLGYTNFNLWFRSFYFHLLPVLVAEFSRKLFIFNKYGIYLYICIPLLHLICGIVNELKNNNKRMSAYHIYIKTESNKNLKLGEIKFILVQICILFLSIIFTIKNF